MVASFKPPLVGKNFMLNVVEPVGPVTGPLGCVSTINWSALVPLIVTAIASKVKSAVPVLLIVNV